MSGHNGGGGSGASGGAPGYDASMGGDPHRGMVISGNGNGIKGGFLEILGFPHS